MHIRSAHLLLLLLLLVFTPSISNWITEGGSQWYRPYIIWVLVIIYSYFVQRHYQGEDI